MVDRAKADSISDKAKEIQGVVLAIQNHILSSTSKDTDVSRMSVFLTDYFLSNRNILVNDIIIALRTNSFPTDWITHKPEQIIDTETFVSLIICSQKQGNG